MKQIFSFLLIIGLLLSTLACTPASIATPALTPSQTPATIPTSTTPATTVIEEDVYFIAGNNYILPALEELEKERAGLARNYPKVIKGLVEPMSGIQFRHVRDSLPILKDVGVNTYTVLPHYRYTDGKFILDFVPGIGDSLYEEEAERLYIDTILKLKKAGFAVLLGLSYTADRGRLPVFSDLDYFDECALEHAVKWANIAEAYNVEFYGAVGEYEIIMAEQKLSKSEVIQRLGNWFKKIDEEVKPLFTGKLVYKAAYRDIKPLDFPSTASFDVFAISFGLLQGQTPRSDKYQVDVYNIFSSTGKLAQRDNIDWMVGEYFQESAGRPVESDVILYNATLNEYRRALGMKKKPIGFVFNGWQNPLQ